MNAPVKHHPHGSPLIVWTPERLDRLRKMWIEGYSASLCANDFGVTRNAIIGVVQRKGWRRPHSMQGYATISKRSADPKEPKPQRPNVQRAARLLIRAEQEKLKQRTAAAKRAPEISDQDIPQAQRRQLVELDGGCCHWPVGDPLQPRFFFCGAPAVESHPYCLAHAARAFELRPPREPRREVR